MGQWGVGEQGHPKAASASGPQLWRLSPASLCSVGCIQSNGCSFSSHLGCWMKKPFARWQKKEGGLIPLVTSLGTSFFLSASGKLGWIVVLSDLMTFCCVQSDLTLMSSCLSFISYPSLLILYFLDDFHGHLYIGNSFYHSICNFPLKTVFHFVIDNFIVDTMYLDHASLQIPLPLFQHLQQVSIRSSRPRLLTFLSNPLSSTSAPCWSIDWSAEGFVQP